MAYGVTASAVLRTRGLLLSCIALLFLVSPAFAGDQDQTANSSTQASAASSPDFLWGRPRGSIGARGSMLVASANSDVFDFVTDTLAIEKSDFNTGSFAAEFGYSLTPRFDLLGTVDLNGMNHASDYRDWEDNRGLPIQQTTELTQVNFTVSGKFSLLPRGRAISRLAWIPRTFIPYVAAPQSPAFVAPSQPMDTLPAWQGGARAYRDPVLEKKKATAMVKAPTGPIAPPADAWGDGQTVDDGGSGTIFSVGPSQAPKSAPGIIREGGYTVFLNPPKSDDKKQAAAKIIAQVQGIGIADALALAGKMIVPVAKDVSEQEAHGVRDMFKGIGLSCRITQKR
jgi:hypothetical protein